MLLRETISVFHIPLRERYLYRYIDMGFLELPQVFNIAMVVIIFLFLRVLFSCWISPTLVYWKVRRNGLGGPTPSFPFGNISDMTKKNGDSSLQPSNSPHDIHSNVFPFFARWQKSHGELLAKDFFFCKKIKLYVLSNLYQFSASFIIQQYYMHVYLFFSSTIYTEKRWILYKHTNIHKILCSAFHSYGVRTKMINRANMYMCVLWCRKNVHILAGHRAIFIYSRA